MGVLGWLVVAGLGTLALLLSHRSAQYEAFEVDARILHRVLSQRMEQQEAVLYALDALSQQDVAGPTFERYAGQLFQTYPQVMALEKCSAQGCRTLTPGAHTLPTVSGVQPAQPLLLWPAAGGSQYALALHRVRVWVDAGRLLTPADQPKTPTTVQVFRPGAGGLLVQADQRRPSSALTFALDKRLGTALQPFPIRFERDLPWNVWPWGLIAACWVGTGVLALWLTRLLDARHRADQAVQDERRRAQGIVQASSDGLIALDLAGRVMQLNPAAQQVLGQVQLGANIRSSAVLQATLTQAPFDA
ncbi:MAG: two-component sensor, partial [Deinococcus sp.]|nr:two-component sensor [Deinococcus sp.]